MIRIIPNIRKGSQNLENNSSIEQCPMWAIIEQLHIRHCSRTTDTMTSGPEQTNNHQCTIHWKPVMTQLCMDEPKLS